MRKAAFRANALPILFAVLFACLTMVKLGPVGNQIFGFSGFFHLLRWLRGVDHEPLSTYLDAVWSSTGYDSTDWYAYHIYHLRFSWGLVYPLIATLYAAFAEGFRQALPPDANYVEILVRAGSAALVAHWCVVVSVVTWAIFRFQEATVRAKVAVAAAIAVLFDYFAHNNFPLFNAHHYLRYFHDGQIYAMTIWAPRGAVSVLCGLYVAARALDARGGRIWLIPMAFVFHLPFATTMCLALLVAEAIVCAVRRQRTPDLVVLAACSVVGLLASGSVSFTGYPESAHGVLPAWQVLKVVVWHALSRPVPKEFLLLATGGLCLVGGVRFARVPGRSGVASALAVLGVMVGLLLIQFATGQAVVDHLLTWHDNPSVHSLLYLFDYSSSPALLGVSLWLLVRGGEWLARRLRGLLSSAQATAAIAVAAYVTISAVAVTTSQAAGSPLHFRPQGPVGEVFVHIWNPEQWYRTDAYARMAPHEPAPPHLAFSDRRFIIEKDWIFNAIVYLRSLHQWAVWGPTTPPPEILHRDALASSNGLLGQRQIEEQPPEKQRGFSKRGKL